MSCQLFISHFIFLFLEGTDLQHRCCYNLSEFCVARVQLGRVDVQTLHGHMLFRLCFLQHTEHAMFTEGSVKFFCYCLLCRLMPYLPQYLNSELSVESLIPSWAFLWYLWCEHTLKALNSSQTSRLEDGQLPSYIFNKCFKLFCFVFECESVSVVDQLFYHVPKKP